MEQMEVLLSVPTVSKATVSSTPKSAVNDGDQSFADLYEQNINESKSGNSETTQKSSRKDNESVKNSEAKVENKSDENISTKAETTEEVDENVAAVNWISILDLAANSNNEENSEVISETDEMFPSNEDAQTAVAGVDTKSIAESAMKSEISDEMQVDETAETVDLSENGTVKGTSENVDAGEFGLTQTGTVSTKVSDATNADGNSEETNSNVSVERTVQNEFVAQATNDATVSTNVSMKQTSEVNSTNGDFSTMMSDNNSQNNVQESVMTQIENSLGKVVKTGNNEVRIQLEPEQLGVINIRIIAGKNGTQVVFKADSHQSSQLIAGQTETLKTMLNEAGIKVDQIVVNDFSFSQENYQDQQTFEQQNGKSNKFYKGSNGTDGQLETYETGYELPQTIVGLNYLI